MAKKLTPNYSVGDTVQIKRGLRKGQAGIIREVRHHWSQWMFWNNTIRPLYRIELPTGMFQAVEADLQKFDGPLVPNGTGNAMKRGILAGAIAGVVVGQS